MNYQSFAIPRAEDRQDQGRGKTAQGRGQIGKGKGQDRTEKRQNMA